jgi:hypothetical protein
MPPGTPLPADAATGTAINAMAAQPKRSPYFIVKVSFVCLSAATQPSETRPQRGANEESTIL